MPARMKDKKDKIMDFVSESGDAPFHPFQAFPYERFEGGRIGRNKTMEFCIRAVEICDEFYLFGISEGTLYETSHARKIGKPIKSLVKKFDSDWKKYYDMFILKPDYKQIILDVVGKK